MDPIKEGPIELPPGVDSREWLWMVGTETGEDRRICSAVTGSAGSSAPQGLPRRVRRAIETCGRSEVEQFLTEKETPARIEAGTGWVTVHHRDGTWTKVF